MLDWYPLSFKKDGTLSYPIEAEVSDIARALFNNPVTDLWVLSYGWNTSIDKGNDFYTTWVNHLRTQMQPARLQGYNPMFVGIFWPSKAFVETNGIPNPPSESVDVGSPAPLPDPVPLLDERSDFLQTLQTAAPVVSAPTLDERQDILLGLHLGVPPALGVRSDFIQTCRPVFDPEQEKDDATFEQHFGAIYDFIASPDITDNQKVSQFLATLKDYQQQDPHADQTVAQNIIETGADALAGLLTSAIEELFPRTVSSALLEFLRAFSFWTMKSRAGIVGSQGLAPILADWRTTGNQNTPPLRIHLVGHSFGAKLLTAALYTAGTLHNVPVPIADTLILFQGAFSQFAFTRTDHSQVPDHPSVTGFYVDVLEKGLVASPVTTFYSVNDLANSRLYPIGMAPVLDIDVPALPGDDESRKYHLSDEFRGSIGANGMQGFDNAQMYNVPLPWPGIEQDLFNTVSCINVNRTPFFDPRLEADTLIGIHNDYLEPEIFEAVFAISQLKRDGV